MLDIEGVELSVEDTELLRHPMVGGLIYFSRNVESQQQVAELSRSVRAIRPEILIAVDQEGGRVQRFRDGYTDIPPMAVLGQYLAQQPIEGAALLRDTGWLMAVEVLASGVDFSFAPVLDIDKDSCAVIANRSFSPDPQLAVQAAAHFMAGMHEAGMATTGKHFPGHGGVREDSHLEMPVDRRTLEQLTSCDLIPFVELCSELDAVMPAHIQFPAVDQSCVGFSRYWLQDILRGRLGFQGVIFSDDLSMKGADGAGSYSDKAKAALQAGCDMVLVCNNRSGALEALDYLEKAALEPSPRLPTMRGKKTWQWSGLETDSRRLATINSLKNIISEVNNQ